MTLIDRILRRPTGMKLADSEFGVKLEDVEGLIDRDISFWSIDESGNPGRTAKTLGKYITYVGMTELSPLDYDKLFDRIPKETDQNGNQEVHYSFLLKNRKRSLYKLAARIRKSDLLLVCYPMKKMRVNRLLRRLTPRNAGFVFMGLYNLIEAIKVVDHSDLIVAVFDKTEDITEEFLQVLWEDGIIIPMVDSAESQSIQVTDVGAAIVGNTINYGDGMDTKLFYKIKDKTVNVPDRASKLDVNTQAHEKNKSKNYKSKSEQSGSTYDFPKKWIILK